MRALALVTLTFSIALSASVSAQTPSPREFVFEDPEAVGGEVASTHVEILTVDRATTRTSLIRIRSQFVDRILDSAAGL